MKGRKPLLSDDVGNDPVRRIDINKHPHAMRLEQEAGIAWYSRYFNSLGAANGSRVGNLRFSDVAMKNGFHGVSTEKVPGEHEPLVVIVISSKVGGGGRGAGRPPWRSARRICVTTNSYVTLSYQRVCRTRSHRRRPPRTSCPPSGLCEISSKFCKFHKN